MAERWYITARAVQQRIGFTTLGCAVLQGLFTMHTAQTLTSEEAVKCLEAMR